MGTAETAILPEDQAPQSFVSRLVGVFLSPGETFQDILRKPDFAAALLLSVVVSVAVTEISLAKIDMAAITRWALEHSSRTANMPPAQIDQMVSQSGKVYTIMAHVLGVLWVPIVALCMGVIGMIAVNTVFGGKVSFKTALSIASYSYLVNLLSFIIGAVMVFLGDPQHVISNPQNPAPITLGFFLDPVSTSKPLMALAGAVDIFTFWFMTLLGIGFAAATGRRAKASSMFLVFLGLWTVWTLIKMGLATLG